MFFTKSCYLKIYFDGGCRVNGALDAIGTAAACLTCPGDVYDFWTENMPPDIYNPVTSQRAKNTALNLALQTALIIWLKRFSAPLTSLSP
jgi:ribonuclease HI